MQKGKNVQIKIIIITLMILICQVIAMLFSVHSLQGNGRVVNYAGIVRGATQRLVKNELCGVSDDSEIARLDDILLGLQTGKGSQNLTVLKDADYQGKLSVLADEWSQLKESIYTFRKNPDARDNLYQLSETYFTSADLTVSAAEKYSDGIAKKLNILEITISITILLIIFLLFQQIAHEVRSNRKLNQIAYIDPQTGLPNKRSCEEKIAQPIPIAPDKKVCCIMFDLNNLKVTNDSYGHAVGDALIIGFASLLRRTMPEDMFIGRLGGDEFIGIQTDADETEILNKIEELKKVAGQTNIDEAPHQMVISFAYGCAFSREDYGCSVKSLMDIADKKMYQNKSKAKNKE